MRLVPTKPMPRLWSGHPAARGLIGEADLSPLASRGGKLRAKLLVFDRASNLRRFWREGLKRGDLGRYCKGAVNGLYSEAWRADGVKRLYADPRYFCVIGLVQTHLSMTVISHEAVHAGFCYEKRVRRNVFGPAADFDEERIAYPAGYIAAAINRYLDRKGLYQ